MTHTDGLTRGGGGRKKRLCTIISSYIVCDSIASSLVSFAIALFVSALLSIQTTPRLHRGYEAVLTFSSNSQLWVESWVLSMNYACPDARVLSNTSAIIIETIEKTIPDGSIIRQQGTEPDPTPPPTTRMEGDLYWHVLAPGCAQPRAAGNGRGLTYFHTVDED